ncbi:FeoA family protein [Cognataquiflexum rubidum]|jgi:ferrous iron transport protein A|uniref:FeoA family protein n=1 Tax=Cognataquiflexum rubidum TaxID=2922273 RepID=UPI001F148382|nr:FeoA family protein [Cognataquiflexum rubidum]MCH6232892.1 ferrous iron transport protein A [Cognataquiflexum rubidum]
MTAAELSLQQSSIIESIRESDISINFLELGILPGKEIKLLKKAPFGGPMAFLIEENIIALRQQEAIMINLKS